MMDLNKTKLHAVNDRIRYHEAELLDLISEQRVLEITIRREESKEAVKDMTTREILGPRFFEKSLQYFDIDEEAGISYGGAVFIMILDDEYSLLLGNVETTSQCLEELEAMLAEYVVEEEIEMDHIPGMFKS